MKDLLSNRKNTVHKAPTLTTQLKKDVEAGVDAGFKTCGDLYFGVKICKDIVKANNKKENIRRLFKI